MNLKSTLKFLFVCLVASSFFLTGCKEDEPDRDKFIGTYAVSEVCTANGTITYNIDITAGASSDDAVVISNFGDFDIDANATVSGNDLTLTNPFPAGETLTATGTIAGSVLTINYNAELTGFVDDCVMTCTKQ